MCIVCAVVVFQCAAELGVGVRRRYNPLLVVNRKLCSPDHAVLQPCVIGTFTFYEGVYISIYLFI